MQPSEVREMILADHNEIRGLLDRVEACVRKVVSGNTAETPKLRESGAALHDKLCRHLDLEDRYLAPALRYADGWGEERARQLAEEHREQRALLAYILEQLRDTDRLPALLGQTLQTFVTAIRDDMEHEEAAVLRDDILRDDVVAVDVEAG